MDYKPIGRRGVERPTGRCKGGTGLKAKLMMMITEKDIL
jgi:hypothetical protein